MGASQARLSDDEIVAFALEAGLKVYSGFKATERRLVYVFADKFSKSPTLYTILPTGEIEGPVDGKKLHPAKEKGLVAFPYPQSLEREKALPHLDKNVVWKTECGDDFTLLHTWTINYNDEFRSAFTESEENPAPKHFSEEAVESMYRGMTNLFGEKAREIKIKYCTKHTQNIARTFVGTYAQYQKFLSNPGVPAALDIEEVTEDEIQVKTVDKKGNTGSKSFPYGKDSEAQQVLYKRNGFTSFMCTKSLEQFQVDCKLHGEIWA